MLFSIICPVYNNEKFLRECIESVIHQSFCEWELIIVDDGSTDNSFGVCKEFEKRDKRIKVFKQKNEGPSLARVNGISKSNGDYICFLDSDDLLKENMLEVLNSYITRFSPDCILFKTFRFKDSDDQIDEHPDRNLIVEHIKNREDIFNECFFETIYRGLAQDCYKRDIINDIICPLELRKYRFSEDTLYTYLFLGKCNNVLKVPDFLYGYRINPNGTTSCVNEKDMIGNWMIMKYIYDNLLFATNQKIEIKSFRFIGWIYGDLFEYLWILSKAKENKEAIKTLRKENLVRYILENKKHVSKPFKIKLFMWLFEHKHYSMMFLLKKIKAKNY